MCEADAQISRPLDGGKTLLTELAVRANSRARRATTDLQKNGMFSEEDNRRVRDTLLTELAVRANSRAPRATTDLQKNGICSEEDNLRVRDTRSDFRPQTLGIGRPAVSAPFWTGGEDKTVTK